MMPSDDAPVSPPPPGLVDEAERAFERGDWRGARSIAGRELSSSTPERRSAARTLLARFAADRQLIAAYAGAVLLLLATAWRFLRQ